VSGTTLTIPATNVALAQNAVIIEGSALVTFTTAPAAGTVDIVYESVLTANLGDYIRVYYQHTPYQGMISTGDSFTVLAESSALVTSLGTGAVNTGIYSGATGMTACTTNLPTTVVDATLKNDAFIGTTRSSVAAKQIIQSSWDDVPVASVYTYNPRRVGTISSLQASPLSTIRGLIASYMVASLGIATLYTEQISAAVPTKTVLAQLVKDQNGVIRLLVFVNQQSTNQPQVGANTGNTTAVDSFLIQGRPMIKGYGGVSA
jgi:hypothetical protein